MTSPAEEHVMTGDAATSMPFTLTAREELLLTAALADGAPAVAAWEAWAQETRVEEIEADSQWLMPLLYTNLRGRDLAHPLVVRCRNVYLHHWYRSQTMLRALADWLRTRERDAPAVVLLKGVALALRCYDSVGARPFESVDVWSPDESPAPGSGRPGPASGDPLPWPLRRHPHMLGEGVDDEVLRRTRPVTVLGVASTRMSAADQLVHACLHRETWESRSRLLWIADAVSVLRGPDAIEWSAARTLAGRLGQQSTLARALQFLHRFSAAEPTAAGAATWTALDRAATQG